MDAIPTPANPTTPHHHRRGVTRAINAARHGNDLADAMGDVMRGCAAQLIVDLYRKTQRTRDLEQQVTALETQVTHLRRALDDSRRHAHSLRTSLAAMRHRRTPAHA